MTKTNAEKQKDYRDRLKAKGLVEVRVQVPRGTEQQVRDLARKLTDGK